ncbi:MAG: hypothetical protein ABIP48_04860 [Planctomycetota bacterium]
MNKNETLDRLRQRAVRPPQEEVQGNAVCLVVVGSGGSFWQRSIVEPTVIRALEHLGIPYRLVDLAHARLSAETLNASAAVLLAQNGVAASLSEEESRALAEAVRAGVGLVNLDFDLRACPGPLKELFGFDRISRHVYATNCMQIGPTPHYVTAMQGPAECHWLDRMVSAAMVEGWRSDVAVLAHGILGKEQLIATRHLVPGSAMVPGNYPALFAASVGEGRAVQFAVNVRLWLAGTFGHGRELDDLFWRSIVWTARKPLAASVTPPLVCLSIDDCDGRTDFEYVRVAHRHGFVPLPSLNIRVVPERLDPTIRQLINSGDALFNTHALGYYELVCYEFGSGECTADQLDERFALHDAFWNRLGARHSETFRGHWGEYGVRALPYLKERGMHFLNPVLAPGLLKVDQAGSGGYWPYGLKNRMYDRLPDDPEMFGVSSFPPRHAEDFLTGTTTYLAENPINDVEKAAGSAAKIISHGLRSAFFGELTTHEQKFDALPMDAWDLILARTRQLTASLETILADHDEVSRYMKSKYNTSIVRAEAEGGSLRVRLSGMASSPLRLSVFLDEDDGVRREYVDVEPFEGETEVTWSGS